MCLPAFVRVTGLRAASDCSTMLARRHRADGARLLGLSARWVAVAERESMREDQSSAQQDDPPTDKWLTSGASLAAGVQRPFGRVMAIARARWTRHSGTAQRMDLEGVIFRAEDSRFAGIADLRLIPLVSPWDAAATVSLARDGRTARDALSGLRSDVQAWSPGAGLEVARAFAPRFAVAASYAATMYSPTARIPDASDFGPVGRSFIVPELEMAATRALAHRMALTVRWDQRSNRAVILRLEHGSLAASEDGGDAVGVGEGDRSLWMGTVRIVSGP